MQPPERFARRAHQLKALPHTQLELPVQRHRVPQRQRAPVLVTDEQCSPRHRMKFKVQDEGPKCV